MVSADDRSTPILAYSFENSLELEMIPPNLFWVIEKYKNNLLLQIKYNQTSSEAMQSKWIKFLHGKALLRQINNSVDPLIPQNLIRMGIGIINAQQDAEVRKH